MNKKEIVAFMETVPAGEQVKLVERIKANGTVETARLRFYMGQEKQLSVLLYVNHIGQKQEYFISSPNGNYAIAGDDDNIILDVVIPVNYDDELVCVAKNNSLEYDYDLNVLVSIDYYMGTDRVVGGVI